MCSADEFGPEPRLRRTRAAVQSNFVRARLIPMVWSLACFHVFEIVSFVLVRKRPFAYSCSLVTPVFFMFCFSREMAPGRAHLRPTCARLRSPQTALPKFVRGRRPFAPYCGLSKLGVFHVLKASGISVRASVLVPSSSAEQVRLLIPRVWRTFVFFHGFIVSNSRQENYTQVQHSSHSTMPRLRRTFVLSQKSGTKPTVSASVCVRSGALLPACARLSFMSRSFALVRAPMCRALHDLSQKSRKAVRRHSWWGGKWK